MRAINIYLTRAVLAEWEGQGFADRSSGVSVVPALETFGSSQTPRLILRAVRLGAPVAVIYGYLGKPDMMSDTSREDNTGALVFADATAGNNDLYFMVGGTWAADTLFTMSNAMKAALSAVNAAQTIPASTPVPGPPGAGVPNGGSDGEIIARDGSVIVWQDPVREGPIAEANPAALLTNFGAVPDYNWLTDNYAAATDAAAAIVAAAATGKRIKVPAGDYYTTNAGNAHRLLETIDWEGPGRIFLTWLNGRREQAGPLLRAGVPNQSIGQRLMAGVLLGGYSFSGHGTLLGATCVSGPIMKPTDFTYMEMNFYTGAPSCFGQAQSGTNRIIYTYGKLYGDSSVGDVVGFGDTRYRISAKDNDGINVTTVSGSAVSFTSTYERGLRWAYDVRRGLCNTNGNTVTFVDGDSSFWTFYYGTGEHSIYIGGSWYGVTGIADDRTLTIDTNLGTLSAVGFVLKTHVGFIIGDRIQSIYGGREENFLRAINEVGECIFDLQGYVGGSVPREMPLIIQGASSHDGRASRDHMIVLADGRAGFGETRAGLKDSPATFNVYRESAVVQGAGTTRTTLSRMRTAFAGDVRYADAYFLNDYAGINLQSRTVVGTTPTRIQPEGGGLLLHAAGAKPSGVDIGLGGVTAPVVDNAYPLGLAGYRWQSIAAATSIIVTSDERGKREIKRSILGLEFINAIAPVSFKFVSGGMDPVERQEQYEVEEDDVEEYEEEDEESVFEIVDGKAVETRRPVMRQKQRLRYDVYPVVDADGAPVMESVKVTDDEGNVIGIEQRQKSIQLVRRRRVMKTRTVVVPEDRAGSRTHYGFISQQVKAVLDAMGISDFGGWTLENPADPDSRQGLRLEEFIAPMCRAIQELAEEVDRLKSS